MLMSRYTAMLVMAIGFTAAGVACSDDDDDNGADDAGGGTDGGSSDGGGRDGGGGDSSAGDSGGEPGSGCTSAADLAADMREDFGPAMDQSIVQVAAACAPSCAFGADRPGCFAMCVETGTDNAVSSSCATCWGLAFDCMLQNCLAVCMRGASPACTACTCGDNPASVSCWGTFDDCAGIEKEAEFCGAAPDGGTPDASTADGGTSDGGTSDGGAPDAGPPDSGPPDSGGQP
jgi:hypothetical protein